MLTIQLKNDSYKKVIKNEAEFWDEREEKESDNQFWGERRRLIQYYVDIEREKKEHYLHEYSLSLKTIVAVRFSFVYED